MNDETYFVRVELREAVLLKPNGAMVYRYSARPGTTVVNAVVSGTGRDALVTINYSNGRTDVYRPNGAFVRGW